ncbi:MAG: hypothetical protein KDC90_17285 [Ignavibacteriae bacterium]|nr:hypothetical protein [Ignavibacteriota bacterium]
MLIFRDECRSHEDNNIRNTYDIMLNEGIDKFKMFWSASNYGGNSFNTIKK